MSKLAEKIFGKKVLDKIAAEKQNHYRVTVRQQGRGVTYVVEHWCLGKPGSPTAQTGEFRVKEVFTNQEDCAKFLRSLKNAHIEYTTKVIAARK